MLILYIIYDDFSTTDPNLPNHPVCDFRFPESRGDQIRDSQSPPMPTMGTRFFLAEGVSPRGGGGPGRDLSVYQCVWDRPGGPTIRLG